MMGYICTLYTVKHPIKDTPKEDKPPNKGQAESTHAYTRIHTKPPLKEDNLSTKDKMAGPEGVLIKRFHCSSQKSGGCRGLFTRTSGK